MKWTSQCYSSDRMPYGDSPTHCNQHALLSVSSYSPSPHRTGKRRLKRHDSHRYIVRSRQKSVRQNRCDETHHRQKCLGTATSGNIEPEKYRFDTNRKRKPHRMFYRPPPPCRHELTTPQERSHAKSAGPSMLTKRCLQAIRWSIQQITKPNNFE